MAVILTAAACATAHAPKAPPLTMSADAARQKGDLALARSEYAAAIAAPEFARLAPEAQYAVLSEAADVDGRISQQPGFDSKHELKPLALEVMGYWRKICALPQAKPSDWYSRLLTGELLADVDDSLEVVTALARLDALKPVDERAIFELGYWTPESPRQAEAIFQLRLALFRDHWLTASGAQPNELWLRLALTLLERSDLATANEVVSRIDGVWTQIEMRIDKRFDVLHRKFDVQKSFAEDLARRRALVKQSPRSLEALNELIGTLASMAHYVEALQLADAAMKQEFTDAKEKTPWLFNERADALWHVGRFEEAIAQLERAAPLRENGEPNVSQVLNLAGRYVEALHPEKAAALIDTAGSLSPYGRMTMESIRARAAILLHDDLTLQRSLTFLRAHKADGPETLQRVLLDADLIEEAAQVFVWRLEDPVERSEALLSVQDTPQPALPPSSKVWGGRRDQMLARPEVQAEIARVGRVESIEFPP